MMSSVLSMLGQDRAFELFEFLIMLFVLISVATLIAVAVYMIRSRRSTRASDHRLEAVLRHLGRGLFGEDAWDTVERSLAEDPRRVDTFLSVIDRESFDVWAGEAERTGTVEAADVKLLRDRLTRPSESQRQGPAPARVSECSPTFGMPVAVQQASFQTRGTIAEVAKHSFTMWLLGDGDEIDDSMEASFVLLSRSGTYQFDAQFTKQPDGMLSVQRPAQTLRSQRRRFDRHPARLPVNVARLLSDGHPTEAVITELSGGGATVTNPASSFSEGHVLNLSFVAGGRSYTVAGRVVRAEDDGSLHVRFEAMRDQERQAISESVSIVEPLHSPR
jgi:PilZ domain-containing protein